MSKKIAVIIGSTRPTRSGDKVADWFIRQVPHDSGLDFTLVDLNEINLPFLDESKPPMLGEYTKEHTKKWSKLIDGFDGFVIVTPEYNHGYPASLKNALDFLYKEWLDKPVAFVSYGVTGGFRAVEQLRQVVVNLGMRQVNIQIAVHTPWNAITENDVDSAYVFGDVAKLLEELKSKF